MTPQEIKRAIELLPQTERGRLLRWLNALVPIEGEEPGFRVAEPALAYASLSGVISVEEYLEGECDSSVRHEYVAGHVYAMAGASDDHNRIAGNLFSFLHAALRGRPCEAFINDMKMKVQLEVSSAFYYPDVLVACDSTDAEQYYRERPTVVVEVLSPHTRRTDESEKAIAYRMVATVDVYCLIEQDRLRIRALRRVGGEWREELLEEPDAVLKLECLGVEIPLARIYERTSVERRP